MTSNKPHSVLIVEDERIVAKDLQRTLVGLGYDAFAIAASADEAMARASERCPDVVLMDIRIKGQLDGIQAAEILRDRFGVPIVYLTAHADDATIERAKMTAPYGYLLKPVKVAELRSAIELSLFRHQMENELRERERSSRVLLRSMADAVVTVDATGRVTYLNSAAEELIGARLIALIGRPAHEVVQFTPLDEALCGKQTVEPQEATLLNLTSGEQRVISASATPLVGGGAALGAVMVFRDITEQRKLQKQLDLSERLASLATLAAGVAHNINNPLAVVLNNADFVAEELVNGSGARAVERALDALTDLRTAANRIVQVVGDLQGFSRPEPPQEGELTDLVLCLKSAMEVTAGEFSGRARAVTRFDPTPVVRGDESRLRQVLQELLLNAAHALPPEQAARNQVIVATSTDQEGRAVIEIQDNGAGIPKEVMDRVFEPFFSTKHKVVGGGRGLGLSISRGLVTALGGEIEIESQPGKGTTVRVRLPRALRAASAAIAEPGLALGRKRILVVDDDVMVLRVLARILGEHELVCLESARSALDQIARGERFDLILSDVTMPDVTGIEFYETLLRQDPALARRVVFITGVASSNEVDAFLRAIPNPLIRKPFGSDIRETVRRLLAEAGSVDGNGSRP